MWYVYMHPRQTLGVFTGQRACKCTALVLKPYTPNLQVSLHNCEPISVLAKPDFCTHARTHKTRMCTQETRTHEHEKINTERNRGSQRLCVPCVCIHRSRDCFRQAHRAKTEFESRIQRGRERACTRARASGVEHESESDSECECEGKGE